jgi:lipopolysaccharide transport system ATP-binding protein
MAAEPVIRASGLGKKYLIGHQTDHERYNALRDVLARNARNITRTVRDLVSGRAIVGGDEVEEFWALSDVDFEIRRGDVVGIIGRNGAGKSTLLKILSRITEPSAGKVSITGRVASLLEVGTGFHPELSGRENIFLNGAILGMSRAEIRRKFDEIVAFAEVERFLDTPVKRYSSGMYVRLAFAVAAHLEPEILVVDEVLAVGDAEFQRKCLGKMETIGKSGRTVLFVSHNMPAIRRLCSRAILLSGGRVAADGDVETVVNGYLSEAGSEGAMAADVEKLIAGFPPDPNCRLIAVGLMQDEQFRTRIESAKPVEIMFEYEVLQPTFGFHAFFRLLDGDETVLFESIDNAEAEEMPTAAPGRYRSVAVIPPNLLAARRYELHLGVAIAHRRYCTPELIRIPFEVDLTGKINQAFPGYVSPGRLLPSLYWRIERREPVE